MSAFGDAFKAARKKFENSSSANNYVFEHPKGSGKKFTILKKGETKSGVMKKFSAPKTSLRPKLRPKAAEPVARAGDQDKGDSYDALMKKKRDAKKKADAQKRPDSGVFKSLDKDFAAQRKASQTPKARADNRDPSDLQYDIYLGKDGRGLAPSKPVKRPRSKTRFPEGNVSSSRSGAKQGMIRAGDEENALDALAVKRAREKLMGLNKGGMTKKSGYKYGGLATTNKPKAAGKVGKKPMVMKNGKKIPAYAADGIGKMNMGGMAKKKTGYMYGGMATTKKPATKMMGGGMAKKKTMTYNMGGMVKSQVNNLKGKK